MQTKLVDTLADSQLSITVSAAGVTLRDGSASTAQLTRTDMLATNGVVHAIDAVPLPQSLAATVQSIVAEPPVALADDVLAVIRRRAEFSTLRALFTAAELNDVLAVGQRTLFAPTDEAFAALFVPPTPTPSPPPTMAPTRAPTWPTMTPSLLPTKFVQLDTLDTRL